MKEAERESHCLQAKFYTVRLPRALSYVYLNLGLIFDEFQLCLHVLYLDYWNILKAKMYV